MKQYTNKSLYDRLYAEWKKDYPCEDYRFNVRAMSRVFKKALKDACALKGLTLVKYGPMYFGGSAFIERPDGKLVYVSIGDIRFENDITTNLLFRAADNDHDYSGHHNEYSDWEHLPQAILDMTNWEWQSSI